MPNNLVVSRDITKKYLDYYFAIFKEFTESYSPMENIVEVIYLLLENPEKQVSEFSIMLSEDKDFYKVSNYPGWEYGDLTKEAFVSEIVQNIRLQESKEWSKFDLFVFEEEVGKEIMEIKKAISDGILC